MTDKEFKLYVFDKKREGQSESQIARGLGMSLAHFMGRLNGVDIRKVVERVPKPKKAKEKNAEKVVVPDEVNLDIDS